MLTRTFSGQCSSTSLLRCWRRHWHSPWFFGWLHPSKQHDHASQKGRALLLPQEVQRLPEDRMIVLRPTLAPLKLKRIVYHTDPAFRDNAGAPPPVPTLRLQVERDPAPPPPSKEELEAAQEATREAERLEVAEKAAGVRRHVEHAAHQAEQDARAEHETSWSYMPPFPMRLPARRTRIGCFATVDARALNSLTSPQAVPGRWFLRLPALPRDPPGTFHRLDVGSAGASLVSVIGSSMPPFWSA
jgi:hypothetical protein